jgi:hypothetical protein
VNGNTRLQTVITAAGDGALAAAAQLVSNGDWLEYWTGNQTTQAPTTTAAVYQTIYDVAQLTFTTAAGSLVTYNVYAPVSSLFLADQETVDPVAAAALITAALATLEDSAGNAVSAYISGIRIPKRGS